ncbi:hypothetical protein H310_11677 [Aphanomyces invadans]|uniref:Uncharacterized protein n=1 Tax=Aphanomyces invadans TaxID=157072 RepID=A0A024TMW1_9STRA|nr:hypothetical protein H310_11677 [Aphanomyces invadans]ETV94702.1 hypothetical protein H310_11677 [Aphanomyces invadans]|eukprot:XP_008876647.1 hypothetical protein H310_11677 [Aphanomyces invadans]
MALSRLDGHRRRGSARVVTNTRRCCAITSSSIVRSRVTPMSGRRLSEPRDSISCGTYACTAGRPRIRPDTSTYTMPSSPRTRRLPKSSELTGRSGLTPDVRRTSRWLGVQHTATDIRNRYKTSPVWSTLCTSMVAGRPSLRESGIFKNGSQNANCPDASQALHKSKSNATPDLKRMPRIGNAKHPSHVTDVWQTVYAGWRVMLLGPGSDCIDARAVGEACGVDDGGGGMIGVAGLPRIRESRILKNGS